MYGDYSYGSTSSHTLELAAGLLFGGPLAVFYGLAQLSEKRLIENTPRSKVRSAAIGLVELLGTAKAQQPMKSPVSGLDCAWWHCRVEEYRSNGKNSYWQTMKTIDCSVPFYFIDDTGQLLVNPYGAELRVPSSISDVNSVTRTALSPVLQSWGIDDLNWFSMARPLRLVEQLIGEGAPLFLIGDLVSLAESPDLREQRKRAFVDAAKRDPAKMKTADSNQDGQIDAAEWDAFRATLENEFDRREETLRAQTPPHDTLMVRAPASAPFVISCSGQGDLLRSLTWSAPLTMVAGIGASAIGVWLATVLDWSPVVIVGIVGLSFIIKMIVKKGVVSWG